MAAIPRVAAVITDGIAQLEAMGPGALGDSVIKGLSEDAAPMWEPMRVIMGNRLRRNPYRLVFGSVPDDETSAAMSVHPDGSGTLLVSDSLRRLLNYFAGRVIGRDPRSSHAVPLATVAIRYHVLHRRLFGLAALLGVTYPGRLEDHRESLAALGRRRPTLRWCAACTTPCPAQGQTVRLSYSFCEGILVVVQELPGEVFGELDVDSEHFREDNAEHASGVRGVEELIRRTNPATLGQ